jgi:hypothetical protein
MKLFNKTVSLSKETENLMVVFFSIFNIHSSGRANNLIMLLISITDKQVPAKS